MPKRKRQQVTEDEAVTETHTDGQANEQKPPSTKRAAPTKRKSKAEQEAELVAMPLAQRTLGQKLNIGAHVSAAGGECHCNRPALGSEAKLIAIGKASINLFSIRFTLERTHSPFF